MLQFKNPRVAKHFEATVEQDRKVNVPGPKRWIYVGMLSGIGIAAAREMISQGVDLVKPITTEEEVVAAEAEESNEEVS